MINVNQITAQLARMPDQALQRYAQMHKADPYILSLALAESNRRRDMRAGAQAGAPEQPKVVDQALAGMGAGLPALPADNLRGMEQAMAAGGIVAFDEGGEVERYQYGGLLSGFGFGATPEDMALDELRRQEILKQRKAKEDAERLKFLETAAPEVAQRLKAANAAQPQTTPAAQPSALPAPPTTLAPSPTGATQPQTRTQNAASQMMQAGIPGLTQTATGTAQELQNMRGAFADEVPFSQQQGIDRFRAAREGAAKEGLAKLQKDVETQGPGMVDAEQRAKAKAERLTQSEALAGPMALFQAGLAIMSGESPHAMTNIGRGGAAGLKAYAENLDKLESSRDKLDDVFSKIETFRQNRADMNKREVRAAEADIRNAAVEAEKLGLEALTKNTEANRADARSAFQVLAQNREAAFRTASAERISQAQIANQRDIAQMLPGEMRAAMLLGQGSSEADRIRSGVPALMELKDRMTDTKIGELYVKHVADAKARMQEPMSPTDFARTLKSAVSAYRPTVADVPTTRER